MDQRVPTIDHRRGDGGFTLVEILIAIVLIGILSAVAVLGIGSLVGKAKATACTAERDALTTAVTAYFAVNSVDTIPSDSGVTPMDTIRLAGLISENSKMYTIRSDGALIAIKGNANHCVTVQSTGPSGADQTGTNPSGTDPSATDPSGTNPFGTDPSGTNPPKKTPKKTAKPSPFLTAPGDFAATGGDAQATFTWTATTSYGYGAIAYYQVTNNVGDSCRVPSGTLTCTITGLQNGTKYRFFVSVDMDSDTTSGGTFLFVTPDAVSPVVAPATYLNGPTNVHAVVGDATATLTWDASTNDGGYPIAQYTIVDGNGNPFTTCHVLPTQPLTCTLTGLTNATAYNFAVSVTNQPGDQASSEGVAVTPQAAG